MFVFLCMKNILTEVTSTEKEYHINVTAQNNRFIKYIEPWMWKDWCAEYLGGAMRWFSYYIYIYIYYEIVYLSIKFHVFLECTGKLEFCQLKNKGERDSVSNHYCMNNHVNFENYARRYVTLWLCEHLNFLILETVFHWDKYITEYNKQFKICKSVHHHKFQINQLRRCKNFSSLLLEFTRMYSSTCFGRPHAHHQELNNCSSSLWFYRWSVVVAVLLVVVGPVVRPDHDQR